MAGDVRRVRAGTLRPHPLNQVIYRHGADDDLIASIAERGVLEPLVITPQRTVISGHRRLAAAISLGMKMVPARTVRFEDEVRALVEFNRTRTKVWSERYAELAVLLPGLQSAAAASRANGARRGAAARHGLPVTNVGQSHGRCRIYEEAGRVSGLGRESARKLIRVFEALHAGDVPDRLVERLDAGELSLHKAYLTVRRAQGRIAAPRRALPASWAEVADPFDVWIWSKRATEFDLPGADPGPAPPPQAWVRLVLLLTDPGDLVVDPMAGTGTVARVCKALDRKCLAFDIEPRGPEVQRHDLLSGFPATPRPPALTILDPPYLQQAAYSRRRNDLSRFRSVETYLSKLEQCARTCLESLAPGGHLAVVVGNESRNGGVDLAWEVGSMLRGLAQRVQRIWVPYASEQATGYAIARARRECQMLTRQREIFLAS